MATIIFTNFATTVIDVGISDSDISVAVTSGAGALFPNPGVDEYAILAMENSGGVKEIVHLTERSGDTFTILRAQEGTAAAAFIAGSRIEVRMTAGWLGALPAKSDVQNATLTHVTSVAGTNTITGTLPAPFTDYAAGQEFTFVPANTNTGVTTVNWSGFGAKAVQANGAALVGGELVNGVPTRVYYDGAAFQLVAFNTSSNGQSLISAANYAAMRALFSPLTTNGDLWTRTGGVDARIALGADGTVLGGLSGALGYVDRWVRLAPVNVAGLREVDFTGIPSWAETVILDFRSVLKGGTTDVPFMRLGDADGFEATGYLGSVVRETGASPLNFTTAFSLTPSFTGNNTFQGRIELSRLNAAGTGWSAAWQLGLSNTQALTHGAGTKVLSAQLDRVRVALSGTTDNFTSGEITLRYS